MKNVLLASFYFSPFADVSTVRAGKYCKFLPQHQWKPTVLSVDKRYYGRKIVEGASGGLESSDLILLPYIKIPMAQTLASLLYPFFILYFAIANRKQFDAVILIGSPFHPFIITPILTRLLRLPTILDLRDSWSYNFGFDGTHVKDVGLWKRIKSRLYLSIERLAFKHASFVAFATPVLKDEYSQLIPEYQSRYHVIYNGFDEDDFSGINPISVVKEKSIILAGKFYIYTPEAVKYFFETLAETDGLKFIYIGNEIEVLRAEAISAGCEDKVVLMPYQPYEKVLQIIAGSDYCLLSNGVANGLGTKIFDYIALSKPTLCIVPQDSAITRQFSGESGIVILEGPHSHDVIQMGLEQLVGLKTGSDNHAKTHFSRKEASRLMASLLDKVVASLTQKARITEA